MSSTAAFLAQALTDELNAHTFSLPFEAVRVYQIDQALGDFASLGVVVAQRSLTMTNASRAAAAWELVIDVGAIKKVANALPATIDPLMVLVEEIALFLRKRRLAGFPAAVFVSAANEPPYSPDQLREQRQFASVLSVTYRVMQEG